MSFNDTSDVSDEETWVIFCESHAEIRTRYFALPFITQHSSLSLLSFLPFLGGFVFQLSKNAKLTIIFIVAASFYKSGTAFL